MALDSVRRENIFSWVAHDKARPTLSLYCAVMLMPSLRQNVHDWNARDFDAGASVRMFGRLTVPKDSPPCVARILF